MDYTPIHVRRVLTAFGLTVLVALLPAVIGFVKSGVAARIVHDSLHGYGLPSWTGIAFALIVIGLGSAAVHFGRRLVQRPFRA